MKKAEREILLKEFEEYLIEKKPTILSFELQAIPNRKFRFDYAVTIGDSLTGYTNIAIEINGGQWVNGRHNRGGKSYEKDLEKSNLAQLHGWKYLQFTYEMMARGEHFKILDELLK